jgi:hypothetical protein
MRRLLVTAGVVPTSPILLTVMKEALSSSDTSVLTRTTRRNIPEDAIPHIIINVYKTDSLWYNYIMRGETECPEQGL